jgi:hypothetical protein
MSYKGRYKPQNPNKYDGDPTTIIYRSLLERRFMVYCDTKSHILKWSSEEVVIPYVSPIDNRYHRYFVDFMIQYRDGAGALRTVLVEVKPKSQTSPPKRPEGKITRRFITEVKTWGVNESKWKAAVEYCKDRKWEFKIITEKELT